MKPLLIIALFFICSKTQAQVIADPSLGTVSYTDLAGNALPDSLPIGYILQLNIPIRNMDSMNSIPSGSCKIKIGLGSKMLVETGFDLSAINTSQYFNWSADFVSGQVQITGDLKAPLPANFSVVAKFKVLGSVLGYSTTTANFLISNHNTTSILSDEDPVNNSSFRAYKIIDNLLSVTLSGLSAINKDCAIDIAFKGENEINVKSYDIELSKNGRDFNKGGSLNADNRINYTFHLPLTDLNAAALLYVRIKSVDLDGQYKFSTTVKVKGTCDGKLVLSVFPNPIFNNDHITIKATGSLLNGSYTVVLYDATGKLIATRQYDFINQHEFNYPVSAIAAGQYVLKIINSDSKEATTFKIQKH